LRKEASNVNAPSFTQIAYQVSTEKDKLSYRIALAEYFSEFSFDMKLNFHAIKQFNCVCSIKANYSNG